MAMRIEYEMTSLLPGVRFLKTLERSPVQMFQQTTMECDGVVAVIGLNWLCDEDIDLLDDPFDHVRIEIGSALALGISVVPILVDGAEVLG